jgi:serine/threonine protein kinase
MITTLEKPPFMDKDLAEVGAEARDLIQQLLKKDPASRPTASLALGHAWLSASNERLSTAGSGALTGASDNLG